MARNISKSVAVRWSILKLLYYICTDVYKTGVKLYRSNRYKIDNNEPVRFSAEVQTNIFFVKSKNLNDDNVVDIGSKVKL